MRLYYVYTESATAPAESRKEKPPAGIADSFAHNLADEIPAAGELRP